MNPTATEIAENDDRWRGNWGHRFTPGRPPSWWRNQSLRGLSMDGLDFLAVDETTNRLYWNGEELQTRQTVRLEGLTLAAAIVATASAFGLFVIEFGRAINWWT